MQDLGKLLERIVKCTVAYNGQSVQFSEKFLAYMDEMELGISQEDDTITLTTKMKQDLK